MGGNNRGVSFLGGNRPRGKLTGENDRGGNEREKWQWTVCLVYCCLCCLFVNYVCCTWACMLVKSAALLVHLKSACIIIIIISSSSSCSCSSSSSCSNIIRRWFPMPIVAGSSQARGKDFWLRYETLRITEGSLRVLQLPPSLQNNTGCSQFIFETIKLFSFQLPNSDLPAFIRRICLVNCCHCYVFVNCLLHVSVYEMLVQVCTLCVCLASSIIIIIIMKVLKISRLPYAWVYRYNLCSTLWPILTYSFFISSL